MAGILSLLSTCGNSKCTAEESETQEDQEPQSGWEMQAIRQWEQQIRDSCTSSCLPSCTPSCVPESCAPSAPIGADEERRVRLAVFPEETAAAAAEERASRACYLPGRLSPCRPLKTDVEGVPKDKAKCHSDTILRGKLAFWNAKTWRQNLFNEYVDQWNRVHEEGKSVVRGVGSLQESIDAEGSNGEKARRRKEISEKRYLEALRQWAYSRTALKQEESRSSRAQAHRSGEDQRPVEENKNYNKPLDAKAREARGEYGTQDARTLGKRGCQIIHSKCSEQTQDTDLPQPTCAVTRLRDERGSGRRAGSSRKHRGPEKRSGGKAADLKKNASETSDQQSEGGRSCNRSHSPRKVVLAGRIRIQGTVLQGGGIPMLRNCQNLRRLEVRTKPDERTDRPRTVPFTETGKRERIKGAEIQNGSGIIITRSESEKSEGFCSKGSQCTDIYSRGWKETSNRRRFKGNIEEIQDAQDPKGYNKSSISRKGGKDLLKGASGRPEKQDKVRQQWGQVDWNPCDNKKRLSAAAAYEMQPRNAAEVMKERKLSCLQPRYRTIYRVKDAYCEDVRDDLCGATTYSCRKIPNQ